MQTKFLLTNIKGRDHLRDSSEERGENIEIKLNGIGYSSVE
jgi:hypothetical protein